MRNLWIVLVTVGMAGAQTPTPTTAPITAPVPALVRGVLLERDTDSPSGEFSVRAADNQVFRFQFDRKTYVERENRMIEVKRLDPGEKVEVVSDVVPGSGSALRYARTVHVMPDVVPATRPSSLARLRGTRTTAEKVQTGNMTFSGVVFRLTNEMLVLHTRDGGEQSLLLRKDTRYVQDGEIVDADSLKLNTRVFIRAGKDLYEQVEAYQVIWGRILEPK